MPGTRIPVGLLSQGSNAMQSLKCNKIGCESYKYIPIYIWLHVGSTTVSKIRTVVVVYVDN